MSVLLVIDVQNDFCPDGALPVPDGDRIIPTINRLRTFFDHVIFTQDWHPPEHMSFAENHPGKKPGEIIRLGNQEQVLWPTHCVQGSPGAQFHKRLIIHPTDAIFKKGTDPAIDSYSAFYDNGHRRGTGLSEYLRNIGARELSVCGLATDYCVKHTVLDALSEELRVKVFFEACRGVNLNPSDTENALKEMQQQGAKLVTAEVSRT